MAGQMSIRRYLKPIDGVPDPKGSLSTTIPSAAIAFANREDRHLTEFGAHTPRYCTAYRHGNLSHSKPSLPSMLTARSLNACNEAVRGDMGLATLQSRRDRAKLKW